VRGRNTCRSGIPNLAGTIGVACGTLVQHSFAVHATIVEPAHSARDVHVAIQPDPYFALPSLYGAPAYSRPPRPVSVVERPLDPDDLPLATNQTDEERRIADALLQSRGFTSVAGSEPELRGGGDAGHRAPGDGRHAADPELAPRRLSLRGLTERIRPHS
jgi:hypothetical protein